MKEYGLWNPVTFYSSWFYPWLAVQCTQANSFYNLFTFLCSQDLNLAKVTRQWNSSFSYTISLVSCTSNKTPSTSPCMCMLTCFSPVQLFLTPWTVACQAPPSVDPPGKNTEVGCHTLLQEIFLTQGWNLCLLHLLHCRRILCCWATREAPLSAYKLSIATHADCQCSSNSLSLSTHIVVPLACPRHPIRAPRHSVLISLNETGCHRWSVLPELLAHGIPQPCWDQSPDLLILPLSCRGRQLKPISVISGGLQKAPVSQSFMSQHREEFSKSNVVDKKWFIRTGCLWGLQAGRWEMPHPKNLLGYSFIIKGDVRRGRRPSLPFLSRRHVSVIRSSSRMSRGVILFLHGLAGFTIYCFLCVQRACPRDH